MEKMMMSVKEMLYKFKEGTFYVITIYENEAKLQGKYSTVTMQDAKMAGFSDAGINTAFYVEMVQDNITITLTD
jgi:hypothetical protein